MTGAKYYNTFWRTEMEIPVYPASRALDLTDKPLLDRLYAELQPRVSELTFAGMYLFRAAHNYRIATRGESVVLLGNGYDGTLYCMPPLGGDVAAATAQLISDQHILYGVDQPFLDKFCSGEQLEITEDRDSFDYLYLREELATLPGSRFHKKKNRVNYFTVRHQYQVATYSAEYLQGCLDLLQAWLDSTQQPIPKRSSILEAEAAVEGLHSAVELDLHGIVILVDGVVAAFALGERLNESTAVCQFEKADPFKEGLYQLINREFARLLFTDCTYLNREQDLGDAGLRTAKLSYHPVELIRKYKVSLRQS
jgi:hypothetical protein